MMAAGLEGVVATSSKDSTVARTAVMVYTKEKLVLQGEHMLSRLQDTTARHSNALRCIALQCRHRQSKIEIAIHAPWGNDPSAMKHFRRRQPFPRPALHAAMLAKTCGSVAARRRYALAPRMQSGISACLGGDKCLSEYVNSTTNDSSRCVPNG